MKLLSSSDATAREALAVALGSLALEACTQPVLALMEDDDVHVRRAAVAAAGKIRTPQLLPIIVDALAKDATARAAREALAGYGETVLGRLLVEHRSNRAIADEVARLLGRFATRGAVAILTEHVDDHREGHRAAVFAALSHAVGRRPELRLDRRRLEGALLVEAANAYRALAASEAFRLADGALAADRAGTIIGRAIGEKHERALERLLSLAQALHPHAMLSRASAIEALSHLLPARLRPTVLPLFEGSSPEKKLAAARGVCAPPDLSVEAWVGELLTDGDRWILCAAAYYAGARKIKAVADRLVALLERQEPVLRETALFALDRLLPIQQLPRAVKPVIWDDDVAIQKHVDRMLEKIVDQVELDRAQGAVQEA